MNKNRGCNTCVPTVISEETRQDCYELRESSRRAALKLRILWGNVVLDEEVWDSAGRGSGTSRDPETNVK